MTAGSARPGCSGGRQNGSGVAVREVEVADEPLARTALAVTSAPTARIASGFESHGNPGGKSSIAVAGRRR